jgi:formamidopyrimidine-DNA glycosylase
MVQGRAPARPAKRRLIVPELPDLEAYRVALAPRLIGRRIDGIRLVSPFVLRSVAPPLGSASGRSVESIERVGKRLVFALEGELFLVLHLMIAGRLQWRAKGAKPPGRIAAVALDFEGGTLWLTEASKKKRAWLRLVDSRAALAALDPGGVEPLAASDAELRAALTRENRTLKRALTDPRLVAAIGNAYSDEILWRAGLSPFARTGTLDEEEWRALLGAVRVTLAEWCERLTREAEAKLLKVLQEAPDNQAAAYYLNMIREARFQEAQNKGDITSRESLVQVVDAWATSTVRDPLPQPNPRAGTNIAFTSKGRQAIVTKLDRIRIDEVGPWENLALAEVVKILDEQGKTIRISQHVTSDVIDTSDLPAGLYIISIQEKNGEERMEKMVKM